MRFTTEASKLLTNKYFLYFMVFLATTNVLGYLVTNKLNAVIFFALVGLLTYHFSKNMAVVLLVALIATNFLMANKMMREGFDASTTAPSLGKASEIDPQIAEAVSQVQNAKTNEELNQQQQTTNQPMNTNAQSTRDAIQNNVKQTITTALSDNANIDETNTTGEPKGFGEQMTSKSKGKNENFGPRLDYAATIEESYQHLDQILGSDSIKQLTGDTQKLMQQQQNLFNTMNQMVPVLEGAKSMLEGFDMKGLMNSLGGIAPLVGAPTIVGKK